MASLGTQLLKRGLQFTVGMELVKLGKRMEENKIIMDEERKKEALTLTNMSAGISPPHDTEAKASITAKKIAEAVLFILPFLIRFHKIF